MKEIIKLDISPYALESYVKDKDSPATTLLEYAVFETKESAEAFMARIDAEFNKKGQYKFIIRPLEIYK